MTRLPPGQRHPLEFWVPFFMALVGVPIAVGDATPGSINDALPDLLAHAWGWSLLIGAVAQLLGIVWREPVTGIYIEYVAQFVIGFATLVYAVAVALAGGQGSFLLIALVAGLSVASFRRWWQLRAALAHAREAGDHRES